MAFSLISDAIAQAAPVAPVAANAAPANQPQPGGLYSLIPFIFLFAIIYFLFLRPQQKRMRQEQLMLQALKVGDEVYTKSGFLGTITGLNEAIVNLDLGDGRITKILRSEIGGLANKLFAQQKTPEKK